jgi:hypothetical protein
MIFKQARQIAPEVFTLGIHDDDHGAVEAVIRYVLRLSEDLHHADLCPHRRDRIQRSPPDLGQAWSSPGQISRNDPAAPDKPEGCRTWQQITRSDCCGQDTSRQKFQTERNQDRPASPAGELGGSRLVDPTRFQVHNGLIQQG